LGCGHDCFRLRRGWWGRANKWSRLCAQRPISDADRARKCDAPADVNAHSSPNPNIHSAANRHSNSTADTDIHPETDSYGHADRETDGYCYSTPDANANPDAAADRPLPHCNVGK
jgi:hypothetical protein